MVSSVSASANGQQLFDCRDAYMSALEEMAAADPRVCAVANDSLSSAKLKNFKEKFPDRFVNVGIAEQNMVGVGAGLANGGMIPYVCGASCFLTARAMEQIKVDLAYTKANVKLCAMSPGMAYGQLGPTHHSIEDLAWMRVLPNLTVIVPADPVETAAVMRYSLDSRGADVPAHCARARAARAWRRLRIPVRQGGAAARRLRCDADCQSA